MDSIEEPIDKPIDEMSHSLDVNKNENSITNDGNKSEKRMSGLASIKAQFIAKEQLKSYDNRFLSEDKSEDRTEDKTEDKTEDNSVHKKRKFRGQNKNRRNKMVNAFKKSHSNQSYKKLCLKYICDGECSYGLNCIHSHDLEEYLSKHRLEDISSDCYLFDRIGKCPFGITCRFGSKHLNGSQNLVDLEKYNKYSEQKFAKNLLSKELQFSLRKKRYDFSKSKTAMDYMTKTDNMNELKSCVKRDSSAKRIDFRHKLYLAPLTTVGNLPFRRLCKGFGADITCGEMAMASNLLEGSQSEWALLRRHQSETIFGVQICGSNADLMSRCAQLINENCEVDFIDLNMGCPIDLVYQRGAGSGLMDRKKKLDEIIYGMTSVMNCPLTVKMRTGVYEGKNIAQKVISTVKEWTDSRVALMTLHGRSREQRYTKSANWDYISECAQTAQPIPLFGSGDVLSHEEYYQRLESGVSGVMIARGALIKPWIFTEIKERRTWDISANERLDILKNFVNYGLENWGSDEEGVAKTRRFLLEWLSFLHRYIPVALLERLPQRINERPPSFVGRTDLETLLSSSSCSDWLKISEMFLGKVPPNFLFFPKHKANAY